MTGERGRRAASRRRPVRVDAALAETVQLLELVRGEEQVLARLSGCVAELDAIRRARGMLSERTRLELTEAAARLDSPQTPLAELPVPSGEVGR